jgi:hypothetical protein
VVIKTMLPTTRHESRNIAAALFMGEQPHVYSRIFIRGHYILWLITPSRSRIPSGEGGSSPAYARSCNRTSENSCSPSFVDNGLAKGPGLLRPGPYSLFLAYYTHASYLVIIGYASCVTVPHVVALGVRHCLPLPVSRAHPLTMPPRYSFGTTPRPDLSLNREVAPRRSP